MGEGGKRLGEPLRGHEGSVASLAVSGNGKLIVSGSDDETVRRWDGERDRKSVV